MDNILPDIGPIIDDRGAQHDTSRYALEVDHFATGVGELLFKENRKHPVELLTDCFHACYASEVAIHPGANATAASWWRDFFSGGTAAQLRGKTRGNQALSEAAVAALADSITDYMNESRTSDPSKVTFADIVARNRSIKRAIANSKEEVELIVSSGGGQGLHNGRGGQLTRAEILEMHALLARSRKLRDILEIAGSMMATRKAKKKIKSEGLDHVDGVTTSGDLTRILPSEVMLLGDDITEWNLLRKLSEEQTLALRKFSWKPACKGPIVVCIDGSASMDMTNHSRASKHTPIIESKAFALTMARVAQEENRYIVLIEFGGPSEQRELIMPPKGWNQLELLKWLEHFYDGGTCMKFLSTTIVEKWSKEWKCPKGKTDIFIVTDAEIHTESDNKKGYVGLPRKTIDAFNAFRERERVKCYGLVIGHKTGNMDLVCDKTWITQSMGLESQAVREILAS